MKYQRIEDMRIDQDLTIKEISALLECNRDVYSRYEKGIRDIPIDYVIRLALVCNLQICVSFLPDIFPSQVFFVFSWLPPCFQKSVYYQILILFGRYVKGCYILKNKKDTSKWYFYQK